MSGPLGELEGALAGVESWEFCPYRNGGPQNALSLQPQKQRSIWATGAFDGVQFYAPCNIACVIQRSIFISQLRGLRLEVYIHL